MFYESTRGKECDLIFPQVIKKGLAEDGGLFVPSDDVIISEEELRHMVNMSYQERAVMILNKFSAEFSDEDFRDCVYKAYSAVNFNDKNIAPVILLTDQMSVLELWHGPTCAFKDMALQIMPHFMTKAMNKTGETKDIFILVATSGDTGKAALEGFKDIPGTRVMVFFPLEGVSEIQKMQMMTQEGSNVDVITINGNFDDAQTGVKEIFSDKEILKLISGKNYRFSSANSINWGRLLPQIIYYFSAYGDLVRLEEIEFGEKINFVVPTGNFGNILAGYYAKKMGLPVNKLICASNANDVLYDFFRTGTYDANRKFIKTVSPAMDILISSNLERLLYDITGRNSAIIREWMDSLKKTGKFSIDKISHTKLSRMFWAGWASDDEAREIIKNVYEEFDYLVDPHTAVAMNVYDKYMIYSGDMTKTVVLSTANPFKFSRTVAEAVLEPDYSRGKNEIELLDILSDNTEWSTPEALENLKNKKILHKNVVDINGMKNILIDLLNK